MNRKKQNLPLRLEAPLKSKGATLPTPFDYGGDENAVKGRDERQRTAPLTAFSSRRRRVSFLRLTTAIVVIDEMTGGGVCFHLIFAFVLETGCSRILKHRCVAPTALGNHVAT